MKNALVKDLMSTKLFTIQYDDTLAKAQELFKTHGIHHLPVTQDGLLIGMLSSEDLERTKYGKSFFVNKNTSDMNDSLLHASLVSMAMSENITCISPHASCQEAYELFKIKPFRSLPVRDGDKLVGILTPMDFLHYLFTFNS